MYNLWTNWKGFSMCPPPLSLRTSFANMYWYWARLKKWLQILNFATNKCVWSWEMVLLNNRFLRERERGMASNPKIEYQVFLCIFQKNSAMATLGLKEMGKFLWECREKGLPCWLSQFNFAKLRQPTGQTFFPTFPKEFSHFLQT